MIKNTALLALLLLVVVPAGAAPPANLAALQMYAAKTLSRCPDARMSIEPINQPGPTGFVPLALKQNVTVTVAAFPLPDGLRAVSMTKPTPWGAFSYHGYLDASQRFLMVAS